MYREIETEELVPHPRNRDFDREGPEWEKFASNIGQYGILQNLLVRPCGERFEIVMGERRWTAARQVGLAEVPCIVRTDLSETDVVTMILVENLKRQDLDPIQEAEAVRAIEEVSGDAAEVIARKLDMEEEWVQTRLALLDLAGDARQAVKARLIEPETGQFVVQLPLEFREEAVQMVLHPTFQPDPLNHVQAVEMITAKILQPMERRRVWEERQGGFVEAARADLKALEPVRCADVNVQPAKFEELDDYRGSDWVSAQFAAAEWEDGTAGTAAVLAARHDAPVMVIPVADDVKRWQAVVNWRLVRDAEKALADHLEQMANALASAEGIEVEEARPKVWDQVEEKERPWLALWSRAQRPQVKREAAAAEPTNEEPEEAKVEERPREALEDRLQPLLEEHGAPEVLYATATWLENHFVPSLPEGKQEKMRRAAAEVRMAGQGVLV